MLTVILTSCSSTETSADQFDYIIEPLGVVIKSYLGKDSSVIVPEKIEGKNVIAIGDNTGLSYLDIVRYPASARQPNGFTNRTDINSITIPKTVTEIRESAFAYTSINSIVLPKDIKKIGKYAFAASELESIELPLGLTEIDDFVFSACGKLKNIVIPNSIEEIGNSAFEYCGQLNKINLPNSLIRIDSYAFCRCSSLTEIVIPKSVTYIGWKAFSLCKSLKSITIPSSVKEIGINLYGAEQEKDVTNKDIIEAFFEGCNALTEIRVYRNSYAEKFFANDPRLVIIN